MEDNVQMDNIWDNLLDNLVKEVKHIKIKYMTSPHFLTNYISTDLKSTNRSLMWKTTSLPLISLNTFSSEKVQLSFIDLKNPNSINDIVNSLNKSIEYFKSKESGRN